MAETRILDSAWRSFTERVVPANAPALQRVEMRRCFYAGAQATVIGILEAPDAGLRRLADVQRELEDFAQQVERGRA